MFLTRLRPDWRDERGSLPIALLAALVVASLVTVLMATTISGQRAARFDRDFTEVVHGADAGVNEALHRLNSGMLATVPVGSSYSEPAATIDGIPYEWTARRLSGRAWRVTSTGDFRDTDRTIVATITERPRFYSGAFGDTLVDLNGTSSKVDSYNSGSCTTPAAACGWGTDPIHGTGYGSLGTNGDFDFAGNAEVKNAYLYDWQGNPPAAGTITPTDPGGSRCNNESSGSPCIVPLTVRVIDDPLVYSSDDQMQFIRDKLQQCVDEGRMGGDLKVNAGAVLTPYTTVPQPSNDATDPENENFRCYNSIEFLGDATVSAAALNPESPVVIYVRDYIKISNANTKVNCASPAGGPVCDKNAPRNTRPVASALQIYSASDSATSGGDVLIRQQSMFAGVIYAPRARCSGAGGGVHVYGSLVCGSIDNVGNWQFHFDDQLGDFGLDRFDVTRWAED